MNKKIKVGDKVKEYHKVECEKIIKRLTGVVTKIENDLIYIDRSDGQLWITREKFYKICWVFFEE